ncbi:MAG TPA: YetF domain-containing protein [Acidimicrobiales bacterium]|nr:YetF domain-containing protein [Acidimicrobiales bacterium]
MWHDMFALPVPVAEKILRALFIYAFLVIALRVAGKRELAQLSTFDFVVVLSVANAVQNGIIGNDDSVTGAWIGAMTLFVANFVLAFVIVRSRRLGEVAEGSPTPLREHGKYLPHQLRRMRITQGEVESAIRANGFRVRDVDKVEIYPNGRVAMTPKEPDTATMRFDKIEDQLKQIRALLEAR